MRPRSRAAQHDVAGGPGPRWRSEPGAERHRVGQTRAMSEVFVALIEVRPEPGCEVLDPSEVNGAFARCFIPAADESSARALLLDYLVAQRLALVQVKWLAENEDVAEWRNSEGVTTQEFVEWVSRVREVAVGEFHSWDHDAPDAGN